MKTKLTLYFYLLLLPFTAYAGDAPVVAPTPVPLLVQVEDIGQVILNARAASLAIYPSYDPYITVGGVKHPFGFGAALLYPVSEYAFTGLRVDFLGNSYWAPSAVVGAKYTLKNLPLTPTVFTIGGLLLPLSGAGSQNATAEAVTGVGFTCILYHNPANTVSVNAFFEGEKITNFAGINTHLGVAGGIKF